MFKVQKPILFIQEPSSEPFRTYSIHVGYKSYYFLKKEVSSLLLNAAESYDGKAQILKIPHGIWRKVAHRLFLLVLVNICNYLIEREIFCRNVQVIIFLMEYDLVFTPLSRQVTLFNDMRPSFYTPEQASNSFLMTRDLVFTPPEQASNSFFNDMRPNFYTPEQASNSFFNGM
jgi:hypothetical protein